MHCLLISQHYWPHDVGGSGRSVRELAEGLANRGLRVTVIAQSKSGQEERAERNGVEIRYINFATRFSGTTGNPQQAHNGLIGRGLRQLYPEIHPGLPRFYGELFRELKPTIVHTHVLANASTRVWRTARELGIPIVHTLRDYYLSCLRGTRMRIDRRCVQVCADCRIGTYFRRQNAQRLDAVIGISEFVLNAHLDLGLFSDVQTKLIIPNGMESTALETSTELDSEPFKVGYLGRLHASKGVEGLVDALLELPKETNVVGVIGGAGDDRYERMLRQRAQGAAIDFLGEIETQEFFSRIHVLVVPSQFEEPFGRVILEAYERGIPVVCARRGGAQGLIEQDVTGWLYEPDCRGELGRLLYAVASRGVSQDMRKRCRDQARRFQLDDTIDAHVAVYEALAHREAVQADLPGQAQHA